MVGGEGEQKHGPGKEVTERVDLQEEGRPGAAKYTSANGKSEGSLCQNRKEVARISCGGIEVDSRGFAVPLGECTSTRSTHSGLNGNYSVYPESSEKAYMEWPRTADGYFVGLSGCLERTWSPEAGIGRFRTLPVLNLRPVSRSPFPLGVTSTKPRHFFGR